MKIPLSAPDIDEDDIAAVTAVMRSGRLSLGPVTEDFEQAFASSIGVPHAVAVSSGTAGLHLALLALGIGHGDEVIVPSFTFIAAANAIRYVGATPVFVDIDPRSLNMDPARVAEAITPRTRALMLVHTFGVPAAMEPLMALARAHGLKVIEDACEALGATYADRRVGSFGDAAVFGFYANKQMTTGEGGMLVTAREPLAAAAHSLRNQGRTATGDWFEHERLGFNYRLSEMHAALGLSQLGRLDSMLAARAHVAARYAELFVQAATEDLILPLAELPGGRISWFVYVVRLAARFTRQDRDQVIAELRAQDIGCGRYFAPVHRQRAYAEMQTNADQLPVTDFVADRTIALPFFNRLSAEQAQTVVASLTRALAARR